MHPLHKFYKIVKIFTTPFYVLLWKFLRLSCSSCRVSIPERFSYASHIGSFSYESATRNGHSLVRYLKMIQKLATNNQQDDNIYPRHIYVRFPGRPVHVVFVRWHGYSGSTNPTFVTRTQWSTNEKRNIPSISNP